MRVRYRDKKRLSVYNVYLETGGGVVRERERRVLVYLCGVHSK